MPETTGTIRLRPHHICCPALFGSTVVTGRSAEFHAQEQFALQALQSDTAVIRVIESVDRICAECSYFREDRCDAPKGGDEGVRKWDAILMKELGIPFGTTMTAPEWQNFVNRRKPFKLCTRCSYRSICSPE